MSEQKERTPKKVFLALEDVADAARVIDDYLGKYGPGTCTTPTMEMRRNLRAALDALKKARGGDR